MPMSADSLDPPICDVFGWLMSSHAFQLNKHFYPTEPDFFIYDANGTQLFTPPECFDGPLGGQCMGIKGKPRDMWSLGCVLFVLAFGHCPFWAESNIELQLMIIQAELQLPEGGPGSHEFRQLVTSLLSRDPTARPSARALRQSPWLTLLLEPCRLRPSGLSQETYLALADVTLSDAAATSGTRLPAADRLLMVCPREDVSGRNSECPYAAEATAERSLASGLQTAAGAAALAVLWTLAPVMLACASLAGTRGRRMLDRPRIVRCAGAEEPAAEGSSGAEASKQQVVTPWEVEAGEDGVDYDKLIETFGCQPISAAQIERIERLTGKRAHRFLRRGLFFSHRDLDDLLDAYEKGEPFYIYTGRGPSSESLHLGHLVPFLFTKWLQEAFDVPLVIELTDDEKFLFKKDLGIDEARRLAWENAKDIIACGFDPAKTFIFRDTDYIGQLYPVALQIQKRVTLRTAQNTFGFTLSDNIGKCAFAAIQASPSFAISFPDFLKAGMRCFIPQAIDQDPYFRLCRRVADDLKWPKPALIHSKFLPALQGHQTKMSASVQSTALYMTDTPKKLRKKINKNAFSGGGKTLEEQQKYGANLDVDVSYQYLKIWLEDDEELAHIGTEYAAGRMLTGEVKRPGAFSALAVAQRRLV
ncbi:WARS1 [Symbiodinium natans]|uniref:Tryptophan--tRNA ligase, cytoplasmic n=1 Tax=Symbiodinium natans TaxID=878477 RepID=A0A812U2E6_9DINO|nr:WARS1 [Symbiodinium natans]